MATISLLSAKGAPGVTTLAVGLALARLGEEHAPHMLVVDADPAGGDTAAGVLRGAAPATCGMLAVATARGVPASSAVREASVALDAEGRALLLPGVPDAGRASVLTLAWDVVAAALPDSGMEVIVDAGRLTSAWMDAPWLVDADLAVVVVRPSLPGVAAAHRLVVDWPHPCPVAVLVVDAPSPYRPDEVAQAVGAPLLGSVAFDPAAARVHSDGASAGRGFHRSAYARSLTRIARLLTADMPESVGSGR